MKRTMLERLFEGIGQITDSFLEEAETADLIAERSIKRRRAVKYGAYGAAGVAVLGGAFAAYWRIRANRIAKSA